MTETEQQLLGELLDLEKAVASLPTANPKPDLAAHFTRIEGLSARLPPHTDPALMHYLHKKSYQKARLFLQGRDGENVEGPCGHV